jgi:hypothetical protein
MSLAVTPGVLAAQSQSGSGATTDGVKQSGPGPTIRNGGQSASKADPRGGKGGGDVGDRLHDSAKGFGEALLDGIKFAGRKVIGFFQDDKRRE